MARYVVLLLAPAKGFDLRPRLFLSFRQKRAYFAILAHFWCPVVTLVTFSSKLNNFEKNIQKKNTQKKNQIPLKTQKIQKIKNGEKIQKTKKIIFC